MHQGRRAVIAVAVASALVIGLSWAGGRARDWLVGRGHYTVSLAEVACSVPPGLERNSFLAEVQYLGTLPDQLSTLDPAVTLRLAAAFALHPWVERVNAVRLRGPEGPRVDLVLRTPALTAGGRVLDGRGVLLPDGAPSEGLIKWEGECPPPRGPAGAPCGDATLEAAARTAAALQPFRDVLRLMSVEGTAENLVFDGTVRVRWGAVGDESATAAKLARLRELCDRPDGRGSEIDLRSVTGAKEQGDKVTR
jgi:hypothetical protein